MSARFEKAKKRVRDVCAQGTEISLILTETVDDYNEEDEESADKIKSFPIRYAPFSRREEFKSGFTPDTSVLCYVPKDVLDEILEKAGYSTDKYLYLSVNGERYEIESTRPHMHVLEDFLYYVIGGKSG